MSGELLEKNRVISLQLVHVIEGDCMYVQGCFLREVTLEDTLGGRDRQ